MSHPAVDQLGEYLMTRFRDRAIGFAEGALSGKWPSPALADLQEQLSRLTPSQAELVRRCVTLAIDEGLHDLLFAIGETHESDQSVRVIVDGGNVAELSDGLNEELFGDEGWIAKYSAYPAIES